MLAIFGALRLAIRERIDEARLRTPVLILDVCAVSGCEERHNCGLNNEPKGLLVMLLFSNASKRV